MSVLNVIVSAHLAHRRPSANANYSQLLERALSDRGLNFAKARGSYKGAEEQSFVVVVTFNDDLAFVKNIAFRLFGQESVLVVEADLRAVLHYSDGREEAIGFMHRIDDEYEARLHDGWTHVRLPGDSFYWVASSVIPNVGYEGSI